MSRKSEEQERRGTKEEKRGGSKGFVDDMHIYLESTICGMQCSISRSFIAVSWRRYIIMPPNRPPVSRKRRPKWIQLVNRQRGRRSQSTDALWVYTRHSPIFERW